MILNMESLWIKTEKNLLENSKKINGTIECDVCIIGGGITGITTAYYLSKSGKNVVLLERERLAQKTTGNTTAKITSQHGLFYKYLTDDYGKDYTKSYYEANQEAIEEIAEIIEKEYKEKCIENSKIMLQVKINGTALQGSKEIDIVKLKTTIADKVPFLHK